MLTNLARGRVRAFDTWTQKYNFWQKLWAKDTQKSKFKIVQCSTFLYGIKNGFQNHPFKNLFI